MENVIELEKERQNRDLKETDNGAPKRDDVLEAMWKGIENSKWSRDPNNPDAEPSLGQFITHVADVSPRTVLKLLSKLYDEPQE